MKSAFDELMIKIEGGISARSLNIRIGDIHIKENLEDFHEGILFLQKGNSF